MAATLCVAALVLQGGCVFDSSGLSPGEPGRDGSIDVADVVVPPDRRIDGPGGDRADQSVPDDRDGPVDPDGCQPLTACPETLSCGEIEDGCGGTVACGDCGSGQSCEENVCRCGDGRIGCGELCVDTDNDDENCGVCGRSCEGAACEAGRCGPVVLASNQNNPYGLALDASQVYWTFQGDTTPALYNGGVNRVGFSGGAPVTVSTGEQLPNGVRVVGGSIYWVAFTPVTGGEVRLAPVAGGAHEVVSAPEAAPFSVDADGSFIYWVTLGSQQVRRRAISGGMAEVLTGPESGPTSIAVAGGDVFWFNQGTAANPSEVRVLRDGEVTPESLYDVGPHSPGAGAQVLAVDQTDVYAAVRGASCGSGEGIIVRAARDGSGFEELVTGQACPTGIAIDDTAVFWTNAGDGTVRTVPKGGGEAVTLASDQTMPVSIAVNATHVYWVNFGTSGSVMRLRRGN